MNDYRGIIGIQVKTINVIGNNNEEVNEFLEEYDGYIIDIKIIPSPNMCDVIKYIIIYQAYTE